MKIAIASDHRGFETKLKLLGEIKALHHEILDLGPYAIEMVDYPDYAFSVAKAVADHVVDRGILICGTGIGMCIAANKVAGVRAAPCHDVVSAQMSRRHNDANIMCLSADLLSPELSSRMLILWLQTEFEGGRHARRVDKIKNIEIGMMESPIIH